MNILHITVHLGGGVGSVLLDWIHNDKENCHVITCLNYNYFSTFSCPNIFERMRTKKEELFSLVKQSDVVVIHFWNHPHSK